METINEILQSNNLDFTVSKQPIYLSGERTIDNIPVQGKSIPDFYATVRTDTKDVFGIVKGVYQVVQNREVFGLLDYLLENDKANFVSAGKIDNGRISYLNLSLGRFKLDNDELDKRVLFRTSHDGSCNIESRLQVYRLICSNGLKAWRNKAVIKIRHTISYKGKLSEVNRVLGLADEYYRYVENLFNHLIETPITTSDRESFLNLLIGIPDKSKKRDCITPVREAITLNLMTTPDLQNHRDNAWGLYNAVTQYISNSKGRNSTDEKQFAMREFGSGADMAYKAAELLTPGLPLMNV